jgi:hypothetical protein
MQKIVALTLVLQARASPKARKNIVRRDNADGPYRNRKIEIPLNQPAGPDSGANLQIRRMITEMLRANVQKGDSLFYVTAEFERERPGADILRYFKTITPRTLIPLSLRRV